MVPTWAPPSEAPGRCTDARAVRACRRGCPGRSSRAPQHRRAVVLGARRRHLGGNALPEQRSRYRIRWVRLVVRRFAEGEHDVELLNQATADSLYVLPAGRREQSPRNAGSCRATVRSAAGRPAPRYTGLARNGGLHSKPGVTDRPHGRLVGHGGPSARAVSMRSSIARYSLRGFDEETDRLTR